MAERVLTAPERVLTRSFLLLVAAHFIQGLAWSSMLLLPLYLDWLSASRSAIGAIMAAAAVGGLAIRPLVGWSLDRLGRKPTLFFGTAVLSTGMLLVGAVEEVGPLVYVGRVVVGMGLALLFTGYFTFAADLVPEKRRTEGIALFGISGLLPLLVNPLAARLGVQGPELPMVFTVLGVMVLASVPLVAAIPEAPREVVGVHIGPARVWAALRARPLWPVWVATALFSGLVAVFASFATVTAEARGVADPTSVWFAYAFGAVSVRAFGARLPERVGLSRIAAVALLSYVAAAWVAAVATTGGGFLIAGLLAGIGHGYCFPVLTSQTATRAPAELRGIAMATYTGLWDVATLLLVPLAGLLADATNDGVMFAVAGAVALGGVLLWAVLEWTHSPWGRSPGLS